MKTRASFFLLVFALLAAALSASDETRQVMPARRRALIMATAKALFEPQVKNSLKIGRVSSPFEAPSGK